MKRSRRSLGLLLAVMGLAMALVRLTTEPVQATPTPAVDQCAARPNLSPLQFQKNPLDRKRVCVATPVLPTSVARPVAAACVIVVVPRAAEVERERVAAGWSGCSAFATGLDHLGRPLPVAATAGRQFGPRLIARQLEKLVRLATAASQRTAAALCGPRSGVEPPQRLAAGQQ